MPEEGAALLRVSGLAKSFGGVRAVVDCTFTVRAGTVVGLIGPNGAGKSTAIEVISGFQRPNGGEVTFDGTAIQGWSPHRVAGRGLLRTFQTPREWGGLTVMDNMLIAADQEGREKAWRALFDRRGLRAAEAADRRRARHLLERFGLLQLRDEYAGALSGGQKRLLEFARIAMRRPRMVLLDEPCAGVNPVLQRNIEEAILGLREDGIAVLLVEHNLPFVNRACNNIFVMAEGKTMAEGTLAALRQNTAVIDAYLGEVQAVV
ncbi:MAG: ABC transporter ATP-binding protein [Candidatus Dormibacterales bacterium]